MNLKRFLSIAACVLLACCAKLNAQDLQTKIATLEKGGAEDGEVSASYLVNMDGIRVRQDASLQAAYVKYNDLDESIQKFCDGTEDGTAYIVAGKTISVSEIKTEETAEHTTVWAKIADKAWVCINYDGTAWANKQ